MGVLIVSDNVTEVETLNGTFYLRNVHYPDVCKGPHCVVHNPIEPTKNRVLLWRADRLLFEEICSCGVGHPAEEEYGRLSGTDLVHGCCGIAGHCRPWRLSVRQRYEAAECDKALIFQYDGEWFAYSPTHGSWLGEVFNTFDEAKEYVCKTPRET